MEENITIFTPTYNRCIELQRLFDSLENQTNKSFVWLIVNDGSTDDTEETVIRWKEKADFKIVYIKQENKGKSMAHNIGVKNTQTELFTCVDSDDFLSCDAVNNILECWKNVKCNDIGILARRNVTVVKAKHSNKDIHTTLREARKYGIYGDTMLIYKTDIVKKYQFPYYEGEKFVPENYLYDLLDQEGTLYFLNQILYYGEYLKDGYTQNMAKVLKNNPQGYLAYIYQRLLMDQRLTDKMTDTIRYIAMAKVRKMDKVVKNAPYPMITFITFPLGIVFYLKRYKE